jgi:hypothetical protein
MRELLGADWHSHQPHVAPHATKHTLPSPPSTIHKLASAGGNVGSSVEAFESATAATPCALESQDSCNSETSQNVIAVSEQQFVSTLGHPWLALRMMTRSEQHVSAALASLHAARHRQAQAHAETSARGAARTRAPVSPTADAAASLLPRPPVLLNFAPADLHAIETHLRQKRAARHALARLLDAAAATTAPTLPPAAATAQPPLRSAISLRGKAFLQRGRPKAVSSAVAPAATAAAGEHAAVRCTCSTGTKISKLL